MRSLFLPVPSLSLLICTGGSSFFLCSISSKCFSKFTIAFSLSLSFPFSFFFHFDISVLLLPAVGFFANRGCLAYSIESICSSTTTWSNLSADKLNLFYSLSSPAYLREPKSSSQRLLLSLRSNLKRLKKSAIIS